MEINNYDLVWDFCEEYAKVRLNGKFGFINKKYEEICELKYDCVWKFHDEFARVRLDGKFGYINKKGVEKWD